MAVLHRLLHILRWDSCTLVTDHIHIDSHEMLKPKMMAGWSQFRRGALPSLGHSNPTKGSAIILFNRTVLSENYHA